MTVDWLSVRNFGRVKYFNLSYIVFIGMPLLAESYVSIRNSLANTSIDIPIFQSFPLTFKLLYLASLFYAVGIAIYQYRCPAIIKNFESELTYAADAQAIYERAYPDKKYEIILTNLTDAQQELKTSLVAARKERDAILNDSTETTQRKKESDEKLNLLMNATYPSCVQTYLINQFCTASKQYPLAIYTSGFCFIAGSSFLVILIARKTWHLFLA